MNALVSRLTPSILVLFAGLHLRCFSSFMYVHIYIYTYRFALLVKLPLPLFLSQEVGGLSKCVCAPTI